VTGRSTLLIYIGALIASPSVAQETVYHIEPGDTLRYVESSTWRTIIGGGNEVPASLVREATISITGVEPGRWTAKYDSFDIRSIRVGGVIAPDREFLMGRPFVLRVSANGEVGLEEAPTILPAFSEFYDPSLQFVDFFVPIPDEAVSTNATWADTVGSTDAPRRGSAVRAIRRFRVVGDTLFNGEPAIVIEVRSDIEYHSTLPVPGWTGAARTSARGSEEGHVIYSRQSRTMLARSRDGELSGTLVSGNSSAPIRIRYDADLYRSRQMRSN
jgi:hypothetical protein